MCKVINMVKADAGIQIDILVLDICYMNLIEIIYELGKENTNTVKNLLTYVRKGPIEGMPCDKLVGFIDKLSFENDMDVILKHIIDNIDLNLVAVKIKHGKLKKIKKICNEISYIHLISNYERSPSEDLNYNIDNRELFEVYNKNVEGEMNSLIVHSKIIYPTESKLINITIREKYNRGGIDSFLPFYNKLSFAKNNYWTHILSDKELDDSIDFSNTSLSNYNLSKKGIKNIIWAVNPTLDEDSIKLIIEQLYIYKNWIKEDNLKTSLLNII